MEPGWVVGLGEVLWDVFPGGARLGGAPANFACHARALGARVALVSAVGPHSDPLALQTLESLQAHGVDARGVMRNESETGRVLVELDHLGQPAYRFSEHPAWDSIVWNSELESIAHQCEAVCFGSLAQRAEPSASTIQRFVASLPDTA